MNQYIKFFLVAALFVTVASCNRDEVFNKEQYKNVFAIVSGDYNVRTVVHDYRNPVDTGYISASLGGSNLADKDIVIKLTEDQDVLLNYNKILYQSDRGRYVKALPQDRYSFDKGYTLTIRAGETGAILPVMVSTEGLSPDSVRYIPLRVDTYNACEMNADKGTVLYAVRVKNWWATYNGTNYVSRGIQYQDSMSSVNIYKNKNLYPFGPTTVRTMPGTEPEKDGANNVMYKDYAMMIQIGDDSIPRTIGGMVKSCCPVTITPFANLDVAMVAENDSVFDPDYPNVAISADYDGYGLKMHKTLLLHYRFVDSKGNKLRIKEEMRFEYIPDPKDPRFLNN